MTWQFDSAESTYFAVFPQSKATIVVEGDEFQKDERGNEIAAAEFLPLIEGRYYHFEVQAGRLSTKSSFVRKGKAASHGSIAPGTAVGYGRLYLDGAETPECSLGVEVASEVISYKKDYHDLLAQLTEDIADLQMQCSSCVQGLVKVDQRATAKNDVQRLFFLLGLVGNCSFDAAIRQIVERPQTQLVEIETESDIRRASRIGRNELRQFASSRRRTGIAPELKGVLSGLDSVPEKLVSTRRIESADTLENRFVKYALGVFLDKLQEFRTRLREKRKDDSALTVEVDLEAAIKMLTRWTGHEFFKGVGPLLRMPTASVVLQRREGYRDVLKKWLQLQAGTKLVWEHGEDIYGASQRKMSALYEYWCFFRLLKIVGTLFKVKTEEIAKKMIGVGTDGLSLKLKEGKAITLDGTFDSGRMGARFRRLAVEFSYNRTFSAVGRKMSWTLPMRPDYTLAFRPLGLDPEVAIKNDLVTYVHFDAKYKAKDLEASLSRIGKEDIEEQSDEVGNDEDLAIRKDVKRVDILKMHAYRDAIKRTGGAYVLYPGTEQKIDREGGEILPGLGAFTLSPSNNSSEKIQGFLANVAEHLCDRITRWEDYTYRTFQVYSKQKEVWLDERRRTEEYLVQGDERELRERDDARQNLTENAAARFADPDQYFSHPFDGEQYGQVKWAYFKNLCIVSSKKFTKPDPERIVMISVPWRPPLNFLVQRYVGEYQGALISGMYTDCPVRVKPEEEYHIWEVRIIDPELVEGYMRRQGDL